MGKRVILIVLDSFGIGELPDADKWNDCGSHTLNAVASDSEFSAPNLRSLGLFNIRGLSGGVSSPLASFAKMAERSNGKDTTVGHWEIAGLISERALPTYENGFPDEIIKKFEQKTGRKVLCNDFCWCKSQRAEVCNYASGIFRIGKAWKALLYGSRIHPLEPAQF